MSTFLGQSLLRNASWEHLDTTCRIHFPACTGTGLVRSAALLQTQLYLVKSTFLIGCEKLSGLVIQSMPFSFYSYSRFPGSLPTMRSSLARRLYPPSSRNRPQCMILSMVVSGFVSLVFWNG